MKKLRTLAALTAALTLAISTVAMAAPSPVAGTVVVVTPGGAAQPAQITPATQQQVETLVALISDTAMQNGLFPSLKATVNITAPAGYTGGETPILLAAAGLKDGANVYAYILLPNGKHLIVPCTVKNGYVGFMAPAFGTVAIVEFTPAAGNAVANPAVPAKLH